MEIMYSKVKVITHHFHCHSLLLLYGSLLTVDLLQTQTPRVLPPKFYTKLQCSQRFKDKFRTTILYQQSATQTDCVGPLWGDLSCFVRSLISLLLQIRDHTCVIVDT